MDLDLITRANAEYVDALYRQYLGDPHSVDPQWALFFAGFDAGRRTGNGARPGATPDTAAQQAIGVFDLIHSYRELGHLVADLDPLGGNQDYASAARSARVRLWRGGPRPGRRVPELPGLQPVARWAS